MYIFLKIRKSIKRMREVNGKYCNIYSDLSNTIMRPNCRVSTAIVLRWLLVAIRFMASHRKCVHAVNKESARVKRKNVS